MPIGRKLKSLTSSKRGGSHFKITSRLPCAAGVAKNRGDMSTKAKQAVNCLLYSHIAFKSMGISDSGEYSIQNFNSDLSSSLS